MAPGGYRIQVDADEEVYIQQYYNNRLSRYAAEVVVVRSADVIEDINFVLETGGAISGIVSDNPTFPIWLNIPLSKSSAFFKPLSICETLAVGMAIITP